jgi:lipopolysaccharide export system protein LptA
MRLVCDRIVLKGRENQVLASGNAKFDFKGTQGRSNTISYDISRDQVFLDGNAVARQGQDEIAGEHVWVDLKRLYFRANHRALIRLSEDRLPN